MPHYSNLQIVLTVFSNPGSAGIALGEHGGASGGAGITGARVPDGYAVVAPGPGIWGAVLPRAERCRPYGVRALRGCAGSALLARGARSLPPTQNDNPASNEMATITSSNTFSGSQSK